MLAIMKLLWGVLEIRTLFSFFQLGMFGCSSIWYWILGFDCLVVFLGGNGGKLFGRAFFWRFGEMGVH